MPTDDELLAALEAKLEPGHREPPEAGVQALRRAAEAAQAKQTWVIPVRVRRRRPVAAAAVAVAAAMVGFGGAQVIEPLRTGTDAGVQEFAVRVRSDDGRRQAEVEGTRVGEGRVIRLKSDDLPILPKGAFYEVWFVGPGDTPASPNRISAGTFHPDDQGRTRIVLLGAVDPKKLPVFEITAEPGDGNPLPSGPAVLRTQLVVRG